MERPENFEIAEGLAVFRPVAKISLHGAIELVAQGFKYAGEQKVKRLLVDVRGLTGFPVPTVSDRYWFVQKWAREAAPGLRVAVVARAEMIDPEKFGITVARNAGLEANVFATEEEARAWLIEG